MRASVHQREAEMFYIGEGAGTLVTNGTFREEKRTNAENLTGSAIDSGTSAPTGPAADPSERLAAVRHARMPEPIDEE